MSKDDIFCAVRKGDNFICDISKDNFFCAVSKDDIFLSAVSTCVNFFWAIKPPFKEGLIHIFAPHGHTKNTGTVSKDHNVICAVSKDDNFLG